VKGCTEKQAALSVEEMLAQTAKLTEKLRKHGISGFGVLAHKVGSITAGYGWPFGGEKVFAVVNSRGVYAFFRGTGVHLSITAKSARGEGWHDVSVPGIDGLDFEKIGDTAVEKALRAEDPVALKPGNYTAILEPGVVSALLAGGLGNMFLAGSSALAGKAGQQVFKKNINLKDDPSDKLLQNCPFSIEGIPRKKKILLERGVVREFVVNNAYAEKHGVPSDGYGLPFPGLLGKNHYEENRPSSLVLDGGNNSLKDLINSTKRGVLISGLWGNMANEGSCLIENGKITKGLHAFYIKNNVPDILNNVEMLGKTERVSDSFLMSAMAMPALKVKNFACIP
ncbi:MAG: TldD/PmbA family protein, partial [Candidatus Firestonebacteria bacterium]